MSGGREDDLTAQRREWSRLGGQKGGKGSLRTMTPWERKVRAHNAGLKGGRKIRIDHAKVRALREQGLKYREIAGALGISIPSVSRILKKETK